MGQLKEKTSKSLSWIAKKLSPPPEDERGVYGIFFVVLIVFLIVAVGIAVDGPRHLTTYERTKNVAEEAARYAVGLISNGEDNFTEIRAKTAIFVAVQDSGAANSRRLEMTNLRCDANTGEIIAEVKGSLSNTFSGLLFGPIRTFNSSATAGAVFITPGGEEQIINVCDPELPSPDVS